MKVFEVVSLAIVAAAFAVALYVSINHTDSWGPRLPPPGLPFQRVSQP
jgi:hypothetical protein